MPFLPLSLSDGGEIELGRDDTYILLYYKADIYTKLVKKVRNYTPKNQIMIR